MRTEIRLKELPSLGSGPRIEDALRMIRGVREVKAEPDELRVIVDHAGLDEEELVQAVKATGVDAELAPR